ncbi:MAG: hypothetical protein IIU45_01745 [Lachnospiraceae bacterium]|nr:hypothetical protein [Lachnospiraceae bacterium]
MTYLITKIQEADYGCEERPAGYVPQVLLKLKDEFGQESYREVPDADLYAQDIKEGDRVSFNQDNQIQKNLSF